MITALIFLVLIIGIGFVLMLFRPPDRQVPPAPLSPGERLYLIVAVVPVLLALVAPGMIASIVGTRTAAGDWNRRVSNAGILLSLGLTVVGMYFLWKRGRASGPSPWLCAAVVLASVPVGLMALLVIAHAPPLRIR